ncbi:MAG: hypothetical protein LBT59_09050 [Clostridiales bacterium]|jgi:hypothetical protein|nr:hypothetical protein [Clostridiales bacterium]
MDSSAKPQASGIKPRAVFEVAFDICYLACAIISGIVLAVQGHVAYGVMAIILFAGDFMHLAPRVLSQLNTGKDYSKPLGLGKMAASITMAIFYSILWSIGASRYPSLKLAALGPLVHVLTAARIALCLLPQNNWAANKDEGPLRIWRNIPFFIAGALVALLYAASWIYSRDAISHLFVPILASFAFYAPVVLFGAKNKKLGMLMIPKSLAYVWIILTGFKL